MPGAWVSLVDDILASIIALYITLRISTFASIREFQTTVFCMFGNSAKKLAEGVCKFHARLLVASLASCMVPSLLLTVVSMFSYPIFSFRTRPIW